MPYIKKPIDNVAFAKQLREVRIRHGKSQEEVSVDLGYSKRHIYNLENNIKNVSISGIVALSNYFQVEPSYFLKADLKLDESSSKRRLLNRINSMDEEDAKFVTELVNLTFNRIDKERKSGE